MPVEGTARTLTADANVLHYYLMHLAGDALPAEWGITRMGDFARDVMPDFSICMNKFIAQELTDLHGFETVKNWLKKRAQAELLIEVPAMAIRSDLRATLRDEYGFPINSRDWRYLGTCFNTELRVLVTQDSNHFQRPHKTRGRRSMKQYLKREYDVDVCCTDECCALLGCPTRGTE